MTPENQGLLQLIALAGTIATGILAILATIVATNSRIREAGVTRGRETEDKLRSVIEQGAAKSDAEAREMRSNHEKAMELIREQGKTITDLRVELAEAKPKIEGYVVLQTENQGLLARIVGWEKKYTDDMAELRAEHAESVKAFEKRIKALEDQLKDKAAA